MIVARKSFLSSAVLEVSSIFSPPLKGWAKNGYNVWSLKYY
jgi:hypothetical protein